ncbi:hypothetical protein LX36DRAFT_150964 [Colletotrichum falcatum]|nr:hypothetical protein LX36DRAFT_150964 [Colletotrichum falcatum]
MDGLLRTLTRSSLNAASSPNHSSRNRSRHGDKRNGGGESHHGQMEAIIEALARGLVAYAVQKYMKKLHGGDDDKDGGRHRSDRGNSARGNSYHDNDERVRGGVPNMDTEMLEHLGKNILSKAAGRFSGGGGGADDEGEREGMRASIKSRGRGRERGYSQDRYAHSRERSQDRYPERSHRRDQRGGGDGGGSGGSKDEDREWRRRRRRRRQHSSCVGYPSPSRHRRDNDDGDHDDEDAHRRRRRRHGTDYAPLVESLETLSNTIASLNERQPGHADCEFYDAFAERSGKTQEAIGAVLARLREREGRRQERRGRWRT